MRRHLGVVKTLLPTMKQALSKSKSFGEPKKELRSLQGLCMGGRWLYVYWWGQTKPCQQWLVEANFLSCISSKQRLTLEILPCVIEALLEVLFANNDPSRLFIRRQALASGAHHCKQFSRNFWADDFFSGHVLPLPLRKVK